MMTSTLKTNLAKRSRGEFEGSDHGITPRDFEEESISDSSS